MPISGGFIQAWRNFKALGPREWWHQIYYRADHGNRYYENLNATAHRHRWVIYKNPDYDASQVPPEWHSWHNSIRELPPNVDPVALEEIKAWQIDPKPNLSGTRGRFATYSTTAPKVTAWQPEVARRVAAKA